MSSLIEVNKLKPHPRNDHYFSPLNPVLYEEIKRSIESNGIRDPLKVTSDYVILAGHQRYQIAQELGIEKVPVEIFDVSPEEAEYLLVADNIERRAEEQDPIRKAEIAAFLKEYWGVTGGRSKKLSQNGEVSTKTSKDIAEAIGTDKTHLSRVLKLNELITPLKTLVSAGKLGTTAAEQLAYLEPDDQQALYAAFGESIAEQSVAETKEIRKQIDAERQAKEAAAKRVEELQQEIGRLQDQKSDTATLEAALAQAQKALADRPTVEVISEAVKVTIEEMRSQNEALKSQLSKSEYNIERLKREKSEALELKRIAESREIQKNSEHARLLKTLESAGQNDEHFKLMQSFTSKLIDIRKEAAGMVEAWDMEQVSDEMLTSFGNTLQNTIESLQKLQQQKKKGGTGNVVMMRKG